MRTKGFTAGHADTQIADWCVGHDHRLLHDHEAFGCMERLLSLSVERP